MLLWKREANDISREKLRWGLAGLRPLPDTKRTEREPQLAYGNEAYILLIKYYGELLYKHQ